MAKKFPDLTGDGEVTRADVLKGRGVFKKGGSVKWIQKAIKKPGSLRSSLGVKKGEKIPACRVRSGHRQKQYPNENLGTRMR